jgi:hypothetical protein
MYRDNQPLTERVRMLENANEQLLFDKSQLEVKLAEERNSVAQLESQINELRLRSETLQEKKIKFETAYNQVESLLKVPLLFISLILSGPKERNLRRLKDLRRAN